MEKVNPTRRALLVTLAAVLLRLPLGYVMGLIPGLSEDPAIYYAAVIVQEMLLWGVPALLLRPWRADRLPMGRSGGLCIAAVFLGAAAQMSLMSVTAWWSEITGVEMGNIQMPQNEIQWVLAVLALVIVPALTEEAFFRGGLMTGLYDSLGALPTLGVSTLIFALMHGSLAGFPSHLVISLLCGMGMMGRGRLRVSILMHMSYNGAALLLRHTAAHMLPALPLGVILAAAALWMTTVIRWRPSRRPLNVGEWTMLLVILLGTAAMYLPEILL